MLALWRIEQHVGYQASIFQTGVHHGICSEEEVIDIFKEMALVVDEQNKDDSDYQKWDQIFLDLHFKLPWI